MIAKDLLQKSAEELKAMAGELEAKLRDARFKLATHQFKNVGEIRAMKRDLARVKTVLTQLSSR